jgi:hypothetical protein
MEVQLGRERPVFSQPFTKSSQRERPGGRGRGTTGRKEGSEED